MENLCPDTSKKEVKLHLQFMKYTVVYIPYSLELSDGFVVSCKFGLISMYLSSLLSLCHIVLEFSHVDNRMPLFSRGCLFPCIGTSGLRSDSMALSNCMVIVFIRITVHCINGPVAVWYTVLCPCDKLLWSSVELKKKFFKSSAWDKVPEESTYYLHFLEIVEAPYKL